MHRTWCGTVDFQFDTDEQGRPIKICSIVDEHTRECISGLVERSITADRLTAAGLGEEIATNIGVNYKLMVLIGTALVAVATGVVTVVVGSLPFLGLIVPNVVSLIRGDDLRSNLPWVCLLGIAIVTVCDLLGRLLIMPFEIPVSVILGIVGAVVFITLLLRTRRHG